MQPSLLFLNVSDPQYPIYPTRILFPPYTPLSSFIFSVPLLFLCIRSSAVLFCLLLLLPPPSFPFPLHVYSLLLSYFIFVPIPSIPTLFLALGCRHICVLFSFFSYIGMSLPCVIRLLPSLPPLQLYTDSRCRSSGDIRVFI